MCAVSGIICVFCFFLFAQAVEDEVQDNGGNTAQGNAAVQDNLGPRRKGVEEIRYGQGNHADADADGDEHEVVIAFEVYLRKGPDTTGDDHAEHGNAGAAENGVRNAGNDGGHFRQQAQADENQARSGDDETALNAR